jgi:hypothetical protein
MAFARLNDIRLIKEEENDEKTDGYRRALFQRTEFGCQRSENGFLCFLWLKWFGFFETKESS